MILVLDHYALIESHPKHLDPAPLKKWAEEGFAVVQVCRRIIETGLEIGRKGKEKGK